jgi:hypothetical protein
MTDINDFFGEGDFLDKWLRKANNSETLQDILMDKMYPELQKGLSVIHTNSNSALARNTYSFSLDYVDACKDLTSSPVGIRKDKLEEMVDSVLAKVAFRALQQNVSIRFTDREASQNLEGCCNCPHHCPSEKQTVKTKIVTMSKVEPEF